MSERVSLDDLTSDQLDALHARVEAAQRSREDTYEQLVTTIALNVQLGQQNNDLRRRADIAETELRVLRSGLRANGADPTQIQNLWAQVRLRNRQWREEKQRAEQAEAAIARVRAHAAGIAASTAAGITDYDIGSYELACAILTALDEPKER